MYIKLFCWKGSKMRLELIVDSNNAGIVDAPEWAFTEILKKAAIKIAKGEQQFMILDVNGNKVGECNVDYIIC